MMAQKLDKQEPHLCMLENSQGLSVFGPRVPYERGQSFNGFNVVGEHVQSGSGNLEIEVLYLFVMLTM